MLTLWRKEESPKARRTLVPLNKTSDTLQLAVPEALGPVTAEEAALLERLDFARMPRHIAVIMDGNGRWAQ
jgi:hypothetical protein